MLINDKQPAFAFEIDEKIYVLKISLVGIYELFKLDIDKPYKQHCSGVKVFRSEDDFYAWRNTII